MLDDNLLRCLDGYMVGGGNTASILSPIDQYRGFATAGKEKVGVQHHDVRRGKIIIERIVATCRIKNLERREIADLDRRKVVGQQTLKTYTL